VLLFGLLVFCVQSLGQGSTNPLASESSITNHLTDGYSADQEEQDDRFLRFGWRELHLSQWVANAELEVENDRLENEIARRKGRPEHLTRLQIDQLVAREANKAFEAFQLLARVWYRDGNDQFRSQLRTIELERFDPAQKNCDSGRHFSTLADAHKRCAELDEISTTIRALRITGNPAPSFFDPMRSSNSRAAVLLVKDLKQLETDTSLELDNRAKKMLTDGDEQLVNSDKMLWLMELSRTSIEKHNQVHPEHPMAAVDGIIAETLGFHDEQAQIVDEYRNAITR
jgi:hypothetical protein